MSKPQMQSEKFEVTSGLLKDKIILITGGSLGIGQAVAKACARAGAKLILASRTEKDLLEITRELNQNSKQQHVYRAFDVSDAQAVRSCAQWVREKFGGLDGLVNCAGIIGPIGPLPEIDPLEFIKTIQINLIGTMLMCHAFASLMKNRNAKIVNYSGGGSVSPFPNYSAYAASKAAVVRLTENLTQELLPLGIEINAVSPGFVATRLHDFTLQAGAKAGAQHLETTKKQLETGGVPPEKAAELTAYLLSAQSNGINGKLISAPWDDWKNPEFAALLRANKNFATMRRIDNKSFTERV